MSIILAGYAWSFGHWYIGAAGVTLALAWMAARNVLEARVGRLNRRFWRKLRVQWRWNRRYLLTGRRDDRPQCETCGTRRGFLTRWEDLADRRVFWRCRAHAPAHEWFSAVVPTGQRGK